MAAIIIHHTSVVLEHCPCSPLSAMVLYFLCFDFLSILDGFRSSPTIYFLNDHFYIPSESFELVA